LQVRDYTKSRWASRVDAGRRAFCKKLSIDRELAGEVDANLRSADLVERVSVDGDVGTLLDEMPSQLIISYPSLPPRVFIHMYVFRSQQMSQCTQRRQDFSAAGTTQEDMLAGLSNEQE
jgi:hypothetical protein